MKRNISLLFLAVFFIMLALQSSSQCLPFLSGKVPVHSSGELEPVEVKDYGPYGAVRLFDDDTTTCWALPTQKTDKMEVYFPIDEGLTAIEILNGYTKSEQLYQANSRIQKLSCILMLGIFYDGHLSEMHEEYCLFDLDIKQDLILEDKFGWQNLNLAFNWQVAKQKAGTVLKRKNISPFSKDKVRFVLKLLVEEVYEGTQYHDLCISEIRFNNDAQTYDFYNNDNGAIVISKQNDTTGIVSNKDYVYMLIDEEHHSGYCIVQELPAHALGMSVGGEGVFMIAGPKGKIISKTIKQLDNVSIYGFERERGNIMVDIYSNSDFSEVPFNLTIWRLLNNAY